MTVCIVGPSAKFASGISYYTWRLSTELNATPILFNDLLPKFLFPGRERIGKTDTKIQYKKPLLINWWNPWTWIQAARTINRYDTVIFEWWTCSVAHMYLFLTLFKSYETQLIIEMHEVTDPIEDKNFLLRWYSKTVRKWLFNRADKIVVHNQSDMFLLAERGERYGSYIIPHAVYDHYNRNRKCNLLKTGQNSFIVLFFGLIREYKGVDYLIDAFKEWNNPNSSLYIVGENWTDKEYKSDKNARIYVWNHYVSDEQIEYLFSCADVICLPYLRASSSGVAHIGMHFGKPIVCTKVGGLIDLAGYGGINFVSVGSSREISESLQRIYQEDKGKRYNVPDRLTWKSVGDKWRQILRYE